MQQGKVYRNGTLAGIITKHDNENYSFEYDSNYNSFPICLAMPLTKEPYISNNLFPFFYSLLSEGTIKDLQCQQLRIDKHDDFSRLLKTSSSLVGSITISEVLDE